MYVMCMAVTGTEQAERTSIGLRASTKRKLEHLADSERRSQVEQLDILLDDALRARGINPETLKPLNKRAS